jgi:DNA-binding LytR/AlgR family response regulator
MITDQSMKRLASMQKGSVLVSEDIEALEELLDEIRHSDSNAALIKVKCGRKVASLHAGNVVKIISTSGSSTLITQEGEHWCTSHSLRTIDKMWSNRFVRLDRNVAINIDIIRRVVSSEDGSFSLITSSDEELAVSRRCYSQIRKRVSQ